jgi:membrane protease YdiL (CAAX protease family)
MSRSKQSVAPGEAEHRPLPGVAWVKTNWGFVLRSPWWPVACVLALAIALEVLEPRTFDQSWLPMVRTMQLLRSSWFYFALLIWMHRHEVEPRRMLTDNAARGVLIGSASLPLLAVAMPIFMAILLLTAKTAAFHLWPSTSFDDVGNALSWPHLLSGSQIFASTIKEPFVGISAGISEELFLRGFILRLFIARGRSPLYAATVAALLFAVLHGSLVLFPYYFIFGLVMAALARTSGSVWAPVVAHASYNLFVHLAFMHIERGLRIMGLL